MSCIHAICRRALAKFRRIHSTNRLGLRDFRSGGRAHSKRMKRQGRSGAVHPPSGRRRRPHYPQPYQNQWMARWQCPPTLRGAPRTPHCWTCSSSKPRHALLSPPPSPPAQNTSPVYRWGLDGPSCGEEAGGGHTGGQLGVTPAITTHAQTGFSCSHTAPANPRPYLTSPEASLK